MCEQPHRESLKACYMEAGNWVRMVNIIMWTMASVFVPLSLGCFPLAIRDPQHVFVYACASVTLFGIWVYITVLYTGTAVIARRALFAIEKEWGLRSDMSFYSRQATPSHTWYGIRCFQYGLLVILVVMWVVLFVT